MTSTVEDIKDEDTHAELTELEELRNRFIATSHELKFAQEELQFLVRLTTTARKKTDNPIWKRYEKPFLKRQKRAEQIRYDIDKLGGRLRAMETEASTLWTPVEDSDDMYQTDEQESQAFQLQQQQQGYREKLRQYREQLAHMVHLDREMDDAYKRELADDQLKNKKKAEALSKQLDQKRKDLADAATQIGEKIKMDPKRLRRILAGTQKPTTKDLDKIATAGPLYAEVAQAFIEQFGEDNQGWLADLNNLLAALEKDDPSWQSHAENDARTMDGNQIVEGLCPRCRHDKSKVHRSVPKAAKGLGSHDVSLTRDRECLKCKFQWQTYEVRKDLHEEVHQTAQKWLSASIGITDMKYEINNHSAGDGVVHALFSDWLHQPYDHLDEEDLDTLAKMLDPKTKPPKKSKNKADDESGKLPWKLSLRYLHSELAQEWHDDKNHPLTPNDVLPTNGKSVWWNCFECKKDYQQPINNRVRWRTIELPDVGEAPMKLNVLCPHCHLNVPENKDKELEAAAAGLYATDKAKKKKGSEDANVTKATDAFNNAVDNAPPMPEQLKQKLKELKQLYDDGLLTDALYEQKANVLLAKIGFDA